MKKSRIILLAIIVLAILLRFWQLGNNPPALTWDEVAWGYNAYSLGIDGKDEFGRFLPLGYLESFGDFKPPLYAYLAVIPVKLFGLTELAVRIPSALFGVLTVIAAYFLTRNFFFNSSQKEYIALLTTFFLAISPWHINLSRAAFEANVATFFLVSGIYFFLRFVQEKSWLLLLSAVSFALSFYTFNTSRIVAPLLILLLAISFRNILWQKKRVAIVALALGLIMMLPVGKFLFSPQASLRFKEVNIFSDKRIVEVANQEIANDGNAFWSKIIHNRRFGYGVEYLRHYFDHFHPYFLFIRGDGNPKFSTQDVGQLYLWELPFFIAGILFLFKKKEGYWWIVPLWLLLGIVPAATARETPHALRIETTLPTFQIFTAVGVVTFLIWIRQLSMLKRRIVVLAAFVLLTINILYYIRGYYTHYPREYSGEWQYGYKESIEYVKNESKNYDRVYITTELGRPYIYYLFYMNVNPQEFRENASIAREVFGFVHVERFGKLYFAKDLPIERRNDKVLYINISSNVPDSAKVLKTFFLLNGKPVLVAYTVKT